MIESFTGQSVQCFVLFFSKMSIANILLQQLTSIALIPKPTFYKLFIWGIQSSYSLVIIVFSAYHESCLSHYISVGNFRNFNAQEPEFLSAEDGQWVIVHILLIE